MTRSLIIRFEAPDNVPIVDLLAEAEGIGTGDFCVPADWSYRGVEVDINVTGRDTTGAN